MSDRQRMPRSRPEDQGISADGIIAFLDAIRDSGLELHNFMMVRHGHVVTEAAWSPYTLHRPHMLFSLSKSFTSTAIGLAVAENRLSLDDLVLSYFPQYVTPTIDQNMGEMRVWHLLTMTTGHAHGTLGSMDRDEHEDWIQAFLSSPIVYAPGTHFTYNTGATYMLSAILQTVTNQTLLDYLTPRLFSPLGIHNATWESCPKGYNTGGFGLALQIEDVAKLGQLYLQQGQWRGQTIVPASWISEATRAHVANGDNPDSDWAQGYGYQFWRCRHNAYRGDGAYGQFCVIMPHQDAVVATTSGLSDMQLILNLMWEHLMPCMQDDNRAPASREHETRHAFGAYEARLSSLSLAPPVSHTVVAPTAVSHVSGKWFDIQPNPIEVQALKLDFHHDGFTLTIADGRGTHKIRGTYTTWVEEQTEWVPWNDTTTAAAVHGAWTGDGTFVLTSRFIETAFTLTTKVTFDGDVVQLAMTYNVTYYPSQRPVTLRGRVRATSGG